MINGELKVIPYNPESPHPSLVSDENGGWTFKKVEQVLPISMEVVRKKAHLCASTRTCPRHGVVDVVERVRRHKDLYSIEGLSCGHTLLVSRIAGSLKLNALGRIAKDYIHRGWLFTFKNTYQTLPKPSMM